MMDDPDRAEGHATTLTLVPAGPGLFAAELRGQRATKPTRQPLYDGCRALLEMGFRRGEPLRVRFNGIIVMTGTVGALAAKSLEKSRRMRRLSDF